MPKPDYDLDPAAVAWARTKLQRHVDQLRDWQQKAADRGQAEQSEQWRRTANYIQRTLLGGDGCVIADFDERMPAMKAAVDRAIPAPIDRALRRDHSLCGVEPCSDCR